MNEIITNSFKYAFEGKESGIIASKIEKVGKTVKIQLRDNGIGIEDFEENNSSFGMTLINLLVEQIDGKIEFYNDDGAVFEIEFKDSEDSE